MNNLKGKRLLILGGSENEISLVSRAKELGVYTIVTDYYENYEISPAKKIADEVWNISWSALDELEQKCRQSGIDGVVAGYSEFRVENQIKLCERLGLPCYCTMEQLDITRDKRKFKDTCIANGVPVIHEYFSPEEVDKFPVIVKPVDRGGSIGISVATNREELQRAYDYAMEMSVVKNVIIEDYISDATKIDSYYAIIDGDIILLSTDDTIHAKENGFDKVVQSCWLLPSRAHDVIVKKSDAALRRMIRNMGIQNGYIFFSGFADESENVSFFETGFRLCGGHLYDYYTELGYPGNLDLFIYHALTGSCGEIKTKIAAPSAAKCVTLNFYAKKGVVTSIRGLQEMRREIPQCRFTLQNAHIGQECHDDKAILAKLGMAHFIGDDAAVLQACAERAYSMLDVRDEKGQDMVYDKIDTSVLATWWD